MTTIYHNPRCSKSRAALKLLEQRGIAPEIVLYLDHPPSVETLRELTQMLGVGIRALLRRAEPVYRELNAGRPELSEQQLLQMVADHPALLERPVVLHGGRAAVGRPPENILSIL